MAFEHFRRRGVMPPCWKSDWGPAGLDQRLLPRVTIITSISFDSRKQLGDTLAAIAAEKAGIIKPGCRSSAALSRTEPREAIRRISGQNGCPLVDWASIFISIIIPASFGADGLAGSV